MTSPNHSNSFIIKSTRLAAAATLLGVILCCGSPAFAVNKDMVQLQTQVQQLQDAVARLQQSNDERMGVMKDLIQQTADSDNRMSSTVDTLHKQMQTQQDSQNGKIEQVSGQIQSLNDSVDELKVRLGSLQKMIQDIQGQQQSMSANMQSPQGGSASPGPANSAPDTAPNPAPIVRKGKPSAGVPLPADTPPSAGSGSGVAPADELYKTALGM